MALIWGGLIITNDETKIKHVTQLQVVACLGPYLLQDRGIGGQHNVVLDESHTDPSGWTKLLLHGIKLATFKLKVTLAGSFHGRGREVQLPVDIRQRK